MLLPGEVIVSVTVTQSGHLELIGRVPSRERFASGAPVPDHVRKLVFSAIDGAVALVYVLDGVHTPSKPSEESLEFPSYPGRLP